MYGATPLRYPGGKAKLSGYVQSLIEHNQLADGHYVEPYAGGAGVALSLLFLEFVSDIHLNDIDRSVYAFWKSAVHHTDELCDLIESTPVTMEQWYAQKEIQEKANRASLLQLGFSTFFLNRANRSGILKGGVIGGKGQAGKWAMDARFNKPELLRRVRRIGGYRQRIHLYQKDATDFISSLNQTLPSKALVYLDPPYYVKGQDLYENHYGHLDHCAIASLVQEKLERPWIVSYDNVSEIREMYKQSRRRTYSLRYSAAERSEGTEIMFFSDGLNIPVRRRSS